MAIKKRSRDIVPRCWFNIAPFIKKELGFEVPPALDPKTGGKVDFNKLTRILPVELAKQELSIGKYDLAYNITIPNEIRKLYKTYRPTPLVRAHGLEKALKLKNVRIYYKREDVSPIGSYKLNSSYVQAYYAKKQGVNILVADTGPGNWGMGTAMACKAFGINSVIFMEEKNYRAKLKKVKVMRRLGSKVIPIKTKEGTIASGISKALELVFDHPKNRLSLGCLTAYSALHNTVIGLELKEQLKDLNIVPDAMLSVVGGGSSFSGFVFPFIKDYMGKTEFIAVESESVASFTRGKYKYENPDTVCLMPRAKMYTLGKEFVPRGKLGASGLNYHGKNPLLSLLVNKGIIKAKAYYPRDVDKLQSFFKRVEGIIPAAESCYAIKGAIEQAKKWNGQDKNVIFLLTGNDEKISIYTE